MGRELEARETDISLTANQQPEGRICAGRLIVTLEALGAALGLRPGLRVVGLGRFDPLNFVFEVRVEGLGLPSVGEGGLVPVVRVDEVVDVD